jgi:hypothetical protein
VESAAARGDGYAGSRKVHGIGHPTFKRNRLRFAGLRLSKGGAERAHTVGVAGASLREVRAHLGTSRTPRRIVHEHPWVSDEPRRRRHKHCRQRTPVGQERPFTIRSQTSADQGRAALRRPEVERQLGEPLTSIQFEGDSISLTACARRSSRLASTSPALSVIGIACWPSALAWVIAARHVLGASPRRAG